MNIYSEFCSRMDEVGNLEWKSHWNNKLRHETFTDYSRQLIDEKEIIDYDFMKNNVSNYTGFVKLKNKFVFDLDVFHPSDFLYFERGDVKYSQGHFLSSEGQINKNVFYDGNYCIERNYDINDGMVLSKVIRRVNFEKDDYKITLLQENPDFVNFYILKNNGGVIEVKVNQFSYVFEKFKNGVDKHWNFNHFFDLMKDCDSSFFNPNGKGRLDLSFSKSVSLLQKL